MSEKLRRRHLGVIEGGRAKLEGQALRAIVFDLPEAQELVWRLASCANHMPMRAVEGKGSQPLDQKEGGDRVIGSDRKLRHERFPSKGREPDG